MRLREPGAAVQAAGAAGCRVTERQDGCDDCQDCDSPHAVCRAGPQIASSEAEIEQQQGSHGSQPHWHIGPDRAEVGQDQWGKDQEREDHAAECDAIGSSGPDPDAGELRRALRRALGRLDGPPPALVGRRPRRHRRRRRRLPRDHLRLLLVAPLAARVGLPVALAAPGPPQPAAHRGHHQLLQAPAGIAD